MIPVITRLLKAAKLARRPPLSFIVPIPCFPTISSQPSFELSTFALRSPITKTRSCMGTLSRVAWSCSLFGAYTCITFFFFFFFFFLFFFYFFIFFFLLIILFIFLIQDSLQADLEFKLQSIASYRKTDYKSIWKKKKTKKKKKKNTKKKKQKKKTKKKKKKKTKETTGCKIINRTYKYQKYSVIARYLKVTICP